ncbi:ABC-2 transporter permease [Zongyangia hominis]|uniref:ABC-2 transporter permease n=1 Tax=Zongyangia hominis TaxID=2763677 RepID=A0A926EE01_9FIRM|nr:ABC-2 transporter permease [Zongyangia hominis]MBC8570366.1 ABC-2 transporter permease [Zongyangia hominis]
MQNIIRLIKADATKIMSVSIIYQLFPIVAVIVAFFAPQAMPLVLVLMVYLLGYGLLSYDENYHTQNYYAFLPIRRSEYVIGKYAFSLVLLVGSIVVCFALSFLGGMMMDADRISNQQLPSLYALSFILTALYLAIQYPFTMFLGGVKGRIVALVFYMAVFSFAFSGDILFIVLGWLQNSSLFLLLVAALALYFISCIVALNIYEKRDIA